MSFNVHNIVLVVCSIFAQCIGIATLLLAKAFNCGNASICCAFAGLSISILLNFLVFITEDNSKRQNSKYWILIGNMTIVFASFLTFAYDFYRIQTKLILGELCLGSIIGPLAWITIGLYIIAISFGVRLIVMYIIRSNSETSKAAYAFTDSYIDRIVEDIDLNVKGILLGDDISNANLNYDYNKFFKSFYNDVWDLESHNTTLGSLLFDTSISSDLSIQPLNNPFGQLMQAIFVKPLPQDDVNDFANIVIKWLNGYLANYEDNKIWIDNNGKYLTGKDASDYLNSRLGSNGFSSWEDIMNIGIPKLKYYMFFKIPFDFVYSSGIMDFLSRRAIISHLIKYANLAVENYPNMFIFGSPSAGVFLATQNGSALTTQKAADPSTISSVNLIIDTAQTNLANISLQSLQTCKVKYVKQNTADIILKMTTYASAVAARLQDLRNIFALRSLYNKVFLAEDDYNASVLLSMQYVWNGMSYSIIDTGTGSNFIVNNANPDVTHFYNNAVTELASLAFTYQNILATNTESQIWTLLISGYVSNNKNNPVVIKQNAVDNLFTLFVLPTSFESDVNAIAFNKALLSNMASALTTNPSPDLNTQFRAISAPQAQISRTCTPSVQSINAAMGNILAMSQSTANLGKVAIVDATAPNIPVTFIAQGAAIPSGITDTVISIVVNQDFLTAISQATSPTSAAYTALKNFVTAQLTNANIVTAQQQIIQDIVKNCLLYPIAILQQLRAPNSITITTKMPNSIQYMPYREFIIPCITDQSQVLNALNTILGANLANRIATVISTLKTVIQQTFCYGRAIKYLIDHYDQFNISNFNAIFGRYYIITSNTSVYVNLSAMMEDYSSNHYAFKCISQTGDPNRDQALQAFFTEQAHYYVIKMVIDTIWYIVYNIKIKPQILKLSYQPNAITDFTNPPYNASPILLYGVNQKNFLSTFQTELKVQTLNLINSNKLYNYTLNNLNYFGLNGTSFRDKVEELTSQYVPDYMYMDLYLNSLQQFSRLSSPNSTISRMSGGHIPALSYLLNRNIEIDDSKIANFVTEIVRVYTDISQHYFTAFSSPINYISPIQSNTTNCALTLASYGMNSSGNNNGLFPLQQWGVPFQPIDTFNALNTLVNSGSITNLASSYNYHSDTYFDANGNSATYPADNTITQSQYAFAEYSFINGALWNGSGYPLISWYCTHYTLFGASVTSTQNDTSWFGNTGLLSAPQTIIPTAFSKIWTQIYNASTSLVTQSPYASPTAIQYSAQAMNNYSNFNTRYQNSYMPNFAINGNSPFSCDTTNGFKKSNTNVTTTIMQNMTGLTLTAGNLKNPMYKINSDISWANTGKHQEAMYFIINNYNTNLMQQYIKDIARFQSNFRGTVSGVASPSINYELGGVLDTIANIGNHTQYNLNINYSDPSISNCFTIRNIPTCDLTGNSANPLFNVWDNSRSSNLWEYMDFELLYNSVNTVMPGVISDVYSLFKENPAFFFDKDKARVIFIDSTNPSPVSSQMFSFTDGSGNSFGDISTIS